MKKTRFLKQWLFAVSYLLLSTMLTAQKHEAVILPGNYPDPSITVAENGYYMVTSSGLDNPSLPIWYSTDLQHWQQVGSGLLNQVGDVWAPDIQYYQHKWYIYFTALTKKGAENFVITAEKPEGPWSSPLKLEVTGIDPGHIADDKGNRYLYMSDGYVAKLDESGTKVITPQQKVYAGWKIPETWSIECFCLEGPKLFFRDGYYYLVAAQGGTSGPPTSHMAVAARSGNINGPWENAPNNPVVHSTGRANAWWSKGHGTVFQAKDHQWYMIYHAYQKDLHTLGRQVLISSVDWQKNGWFTVGERSLFPDAKGIAFRDDFETPQLPSHYVFNNDSAVNRLSFHKGNLLLKAHGTNSTNTNPLFVTPKNEAYQVTTKLSLETDSIEAGLLLYYNNNFHVGLALKKDGIYQVVKGSTWKVSGLYHNKTAWLRLANDHNTINYYYSFDGIKWQKVDLSHDISGYNTNTLGGFRSVRAGIYTAGKGVAAFDFFTYDLLEVK